MIELRKLLQTQWSCMYIAYRARDLLSACVYTAYWPSRSASGGGGRVYKIKILRSNLAPEEGEGRLFEGGV